MIPSRIPDFSTAEQTYGSPPASVRWGPRRAIIPSLCTQKRSRYRPAGAAAETGRFRRCSAHPFAGSQSPHLILKGGYLHSRLGVANVFHILKAIALRLTGRGLWWIGIAELAGVGYHISVLLPRSRPRGDDKLLLVEPIDRPLDRAPGSTEVFGDCQVGDGSLVEHEIKGARPGLVFLSGPVNQPAVDSPSLPRNFPVPDGVLVYGVGMRGQPSAFPASSRRSMASPLLAAKTNEQSPFVVRQR